LADFDITQAISDVPNVAIGNFPFIHKKKVSAKVCALVYLLATQQSQ
jgi:hypothetical protein